jgi:50S ribosome-binding GTPase
LLFLDVGLKNYYPANAFQCWRRRVLDQASIRNLTNQLAEDLSWLEQHCRRQGNHAPQAGELRLAEALVRNTIGPYLDQQPPEPLHVAVVGGAGAGKSTVANMLSGSAAAESNPQAGFTRHPVAYTTANGPLSWTAHAGFLGPLRRLTEPAPASLDADVYQVRRLPADSQASSLLPRFVVWDCPDMTTWAAGSYVSRLLEVAGLADVIVYVASDERYNDEAPTQFLHLLLQVGKPVVCCLMKMREENAPVILDHFQKEVVTKILPASVACLAIPYLTPEQLADPARLAAKYRIPLLNQVAVLGQSPAEARRRNVRWAANYLAAGQDRLLGAVRQDLAALQEWRRVVLAGQAEFDHRYRREYLASEKFERFDEALVRLIDLLDLPGVGRVLSNTLWVLRTPYRLLKGWAVKALRRPEAPALPEQPVLEQALAGWLDMLRKEAVRRAGSHPLWAHVDKGFKSDLGEAAHRRFGEGLRSFRLSQADEIDRTARAIYEELEKSPARLNTLRGAKFGLDMVGIAGLVAAGGVLNWHDVILVPLAASMTHQLIEWLGKGYVDSQREEARNRQQALETRFISEPLAEWLAQWPSTGGSAYERLDVALRRIPPAIAQLNTAVNQALAGP